MKDEARPEPCPNSAGCLDEGYYFIKVCQQGYSDNPVLCQNAKRGKKGDHRESFFNKRSLVVQLCNAFYTILYIQKSHSIFT